ncbi:hypothetical protein N473_21275 [Pseudoalteromonas luteoviolacea CPMOR-1]|uniref:Uncharacterized protein n=1 Tax=Pseudoalteromonas luteoviolacea CPMOR-1 TaxID=1365248 RepID=A0A167K3F7_9GAMM|nr:hypothetical protein [Pseudoalteromonas luteoviolacea]KZN62079.1 hypothetical protein N473_21275 [Pseudoalteromonas luteoviolacea CPMOR-1]
MNIIYQISPEFIYYKAFAIPFGFAVFVLISIAALKLHIKLNEPITKSAISSYRGNIKSQQRELFPIILVIAIVIFALLLYFSYRKSVLEIGQLDELYSNSDSIKGTLKSLHSYNKDWDLVRFEVGGIVFDYRLDDRGIFDIDLNQMEIDKIEGKVVEIRFTEGSRILEILQLEK